MKTVTHYETLGVARTAPDEVIRGAYKALAQKNHPDKNLDNPNATNIMQTINEAYDVLSDPVKKADYDAALIRAEPVRAQSQDHQSSGQETYQTPEQPSSGGSPLLIVLLLGALFLIFFVYTSYKPVPVFPPIPTPAAPYPALPPDKPKIVKAFVPKETTSQELAACIFDAAKTYAVPPSMILSLLSVEGGSVGEKIPGANHTYDLGLMHINASWVSQLAGSWGVNEDTALHMLRDDACINVGVGAWILHAALDKNENLQNEISLYHAAAHHLSGKANDDVYVNKVLKLMELYKTVHGPEDLLKK